MQKTTKQYLPGIAWFFILLILLCIPGNELPKAQDWMQAISFDKWVHTGLFAVLAYLFMKPISTSGITKQKKWRIVIIIALVTSTWGLTTEIIQENFIRGRSFEWFDWAADTMGALIALIVNKQRNLK